MADMLRFNDKAIRQMFLQYVASFQDAERHSSVSVSEVEAFDDFCSERMKGNRQMQMEAYEKMMNVAVEFEEDGFAAGFKAAMNLILAQEQAFPADIQIPTSEAGESKQEAVNAANEGSKLDECFITSIQIAELFQTPNHKVIRRIEDRLMPFLDEDSKAMFKKASGKNSQNKEVTFYKLNQAACMMYLEVMEPKKAQFINIAGGYAKLQELMQRTFRTEAVALPA